MREIIAFQCEYCVKKYFTKQGCKGHEEICWYNEKTNHCATCKYYEDCEWDSCVLTKYHVTPSDTCDKYELCEW